jgi:hypothetical protein
MMVDNLLADFSGQFFYVCFGLEENNKAIPFISGLKVPKGR